MYSKQLNVTVVLILFFLTSCFFARSEQFTIQGQIMDLDGPIKGVSWIILDDDEPIIITKPNGFFTFRTEKKIHRFNIHHIGYLSSSQDVHISHDTSLTFFLIKSMPRMESSGPIKKELFLKRSLTKYSSDYLMYGLISNGIGEIQYEEYKEVDTFFQVNNEMNSLIKNISISCFAPLDFNKKIIKLRNEFNPRGFVSPFSDTVTSDYFIYDEGSYAKNGIKIERFKVLSRKKWKPLFNGYIDWDIINHRPYELFLSLSPTSLLENARKIEIRQRFKSLSDSSNLIDFQEVMIQFNAFGSNATAYFVLKLDSEKMGTLISSLKDQYTPNIKFEEPKLQSISNMILRGFSLNDQKHNGIFFIQPLMKTLTFNAVEGVSLLSGFSWRKNIDKKRYVVLEPTMRYGTGNGHLNVDVLGKIFYNPKNSDVLMWGGGKRIQQFNTDNPVPQLMNSLSMINEGINYLKIFENSFVNLGWRKNLFRHTAISGMIDFQKRSPLYNLNDRYASNHPSEVRKEPMLLHQSLQFKLGITIFTSKIPNRNEEYIDSRKSGQPRIDFMFTKGIPNFLGSDVDFDKWKTSFSGQVDFKLKGNFLYHLQAGGFLNKKKVELPDYHHFWGNQTRKAFPYLESFQLVPFYAFSNVNRTYFALHVEHRFKGFITESIPLFRNTNLYLVCGGNTFTSGKQKYAEIFWGLDNVMKFIRIDHIISINGAFQQQGIRVGISGYDKLFAEN